MAKVWEVSRRKFLELLGAIGLVGAGRTFANVGTQAKASGKRTVAAGAPAPPAPGYKVLTADQVATLDALAEQIIPTDQDPGARDTGAVHYIDNVLAGYQKEKLPLYAAGLKGTDQAAQTLYKQDFAKLSFDQQTAVVKALEQGTAQGDIWRTASSQGFFAMVWGHVLEGFYGPPEHGGNQNYASWKMVGFPEHSGTM